MLDLVTGWVEKVSLIRFIRIERTFLEFVAVVEIEIQFEIVIEFTIVT